MSLARVARVIALVSLLLTLLPLAPEGSVCYTCSPDNLTYLIALHLMLLVATFTGNRVMNVLVLTLIVFYASRIFVVQLDPGFYTYRLWLPSPAEMTPVLAAVFFISAGLIAGCYLGGAIGAGYTGPLKILPLVRRSEERRFYYIIMVIYIVSATVLLYLFFTAGVGLPIDRQTFSPMLLRYAKIARSFGVFGTAPICWLILRKPKGFERRITILAVVLLVLGGASTLSKAFVITSAAPFILAYYAAGKKIPRKVARNVGLITIAGVLFIASAMALIRSAINESLFTGGKVDFTGTSSWDIARNVLSFLGRVGSSFDVLALAVTRQYEFSQYVNFRAELIDMVNGYFPGGLFPVDSPHWAQRLMSIGHGAGFENQFLQGTGENITLPGHLFVNFGLGGATLLAFLLMVAITLFYRYSSSVVGRMYLLSSIIFGITNGSGFLAMLSGYPGLLLWFAFAHILHQGVGTTRSRRRKETGAPLGDPHIGAAAV